MSSFGGKESAERDNQWNEVDDGWPTFDHTKYSSDLGKSPMPALGGAPMTSDEFSHSMEERDKQDAFFVLKNVPSECTERAVYNLCSRHGKVIRSNYDSRLNYHYVHFATHADMEATFRALEKNDYGIVFSIGRNSSRKKKQGRNTNSTDHALTKEKDDVEEMLRLRQPTPVIRYDQRVVSSSERLLARPYFEAPSIVSRAAYEAKDSLLRQMDAQRHFLIDEDAHDLERLCLLDPNAALENPANRQFRTGRAINVISVETQKFLEEKCQNSRGAYNEADNSYSSAGYSDVDGVLAKLGRCVECGSDCDFMCLRCSTNFCSVECQTKAWPQHRYVCGKPEYLQLTMGLISKESPPCEQSNHQGILPVAKSLREAQLPGSGNIVRITSISKTNLVFVRSNSPEDYLKFFRVVSQIQADARNYRKLQQPPSCGQVVVASFKGQFCRALILNALQLDKIKLVYIDYGNVDQKPFEELWAAPDALINLPRFAVPVLLKDTPDHFITDGLRKFMYSYLDQVNLVVRYKEDDFLAKRAVYAVELFDETTNQSFNRVVQKLCIAESPQPHGQVFYHNILKRELLPTGTNVSLVVMDNSMLRTGCISCTTFEYAVNLQKIQQEVQRYGESAAHDEEHYAPRLEELCVARYQLDQKWYRGRCVDLVGDGCPTILFLDYGNIQYVKVTDIRRYPPHFTNIPLFTVDCEIKGLPENCGPDLVEKLEQLLPNASRFQCDSLKRHGDEHFYSAQLSEVLQELEASGLLKKEDQKGEE